MVHLGLQRGLPEEVSFLRLKTLASFPQSREEYSRRHGCEGGRRAEDLGTQFRSLQN